MGCLIRHRIVPSKIVQPHPGQTEPGHPQEPSRASLRGELDNEKWTQMQTNRAVPFDLPPEGVKIDVKVIDQTGMEHMKVIDDPRKDLKDPRPTQPN